MQGPPQGYPGDGFSSPFGVPPPAGSFPPPPPAPPMFGAPPSAPGPATGLAAPPPGMPFAGQPINYPPAPGPAGGWNTSHEQSPAPPSAWQPPYQAPAAPPGQAQWPPPHGSAPTGPPPAFNTPYSYPPPPPPVSGPPPFGPSTPGSQGYSGTSGPPPPPVTPLQSVGYSNVPGRSPITPSSKPFAPRSPGDSISPVKSRIDPAQIPSPATYRASDGRAIHYTVRNTIPPSACTFFAVVDEGSCSPQVMRPSLHAAPVDADLLKESGLPWSALFQPLAELNTECPIPIVNFGASGPLRCKRCRAYINAFVQFVDQGKKWKCNFCEVLNEVPHDYFCNIDADGKRRDQADRMELSRGSVEYDVQSVAEYCFRGNSTTEKPSPEDYQPVELPLNYIFLIDISSAASAILPSIIKATAKAIEALAEQDVECNCCVSFITYGSTLQFYDFTRPNMPMHVVSDINDVFVPLPFNKVCWLNIHNDQDKISEFLKQLPLFVDDLREPHSCVGSALVAAYLVLAESGGRVVCCCTGPPRIGMGTFKLRDELKLYGSDNEKQLFSPVEGLWTTLALDFAKKQICVDMFCFSFSQYSDLATLGEVCRLTSGQLSEYLNFHPQKDYDRLCHALKRNVTRAAGYAAIVRVRCSRGIRVKDYDGHYLCQDPLDMDLAGIDEDKAFLVELQHDDKLDPNADSYLQGALLYTNRNGQRRIRVHTLRMTVVTTFPNLFRHADLDVTVATICRRAARMAMRKGLTAAQDCITNLCTDFLATYRKHCAANPSPGQLILPEALKLAPIYCLGMIKGPVFRNGTDVRLDERLYAWFEIHQLTAGCALPFIYPRMFPLHSLGATAGNYDDERGCIVLPNTDNLCSEKIVPHGIYLMHDLPTHQMLIWIGERANPKTVQSLFNCDTVELLDEVWVETKSAPRMANIIQELRRQRPQSFDAIRVIWEKRDPVAEALFLGRLIEDKTGPNNWSYVDYLCQLHRNIQTKLS